MHQLVIANAEIIARKNQQLHRELAHLGVKDGKISEISSTRLDGQAVVDAKGLVVLPGVIDSQVHFREPGLTHKEDLESGSRSAVMGGVTTYFEMPNTNPPTISRERINEKLALARGRSWANYGFFVGASAENVNELSELEKMDGVAGVKIFMGSSTGNLLVPDDELLLRVLRSGQRRVIVHAEDETRLKSRKHIAVESGDVHTHPLWRDEETAYLATQRLLKLARTTGRQIHVLHVTTQKECELLAQNKDIATFEVTPQHLTFSAPECYDHLSTLAQMNPPIRGRLHQNALLHAVKEGIVDVIGSDHAPHTLEEKKLPYPQSPSGMPGVQTLLPVMLNHVHQGHLSLEQLVTLVCEGPRKVFGCKNKGRIEVGQDADLTIVDLGKEQVIENNWIESRCQWTPFNGMKVRGWPVMTVVGGQIVMRDNALLGVPQGKRVQF